MATNNLTQEQVLRNMRAALDRLLPAKLADRPVNGAVVQAHMLRHPDDFIPATVDAFYRAFLAVQADLQWEIPPASLIAAKNTTQTTQEIIRLVEEYQRGGYAPKDLVMDESNSAILLNYVIEKWGICTITYLRQGVAELGSRLARTEQPKPLTKVQEAKLIQDHMDSDLRKSREDSKTLVQNSFGQKRLAENAKTANEKEIARINAETDSEVNSYFVGHPSGGRQYGLTDSGIAELRAVRDKHTARTKTVENAQAALAAVRAKKVQLP